MTYPKINLKIISANLGPDHLAETCCDKSSRVENVWSLRIFLTCILPFIGLIYYSARWPSQVFVNNLSLHESGTVWSRTCHLMIAS